LTVISTFATIEEASKATFIDTSSIGRSCRGEQRIGLQWLFKYADNTNTIITKKGKSVTRIDLRTGSKEVFISINDAHRKTKTAIDTINRHCKNNIEKTQDGLYKWQFT